jgi:hypothetical protein
LKTESFDFYGGFVPSGYKDYQTCRLLGRKPNSFNSWGVIENFERKVFKAKVKKILGIKGSISSFELLHVGCWISIDGPVGKEGPLNSIVGRWETGGSGSADEYIPMNIVFAKYPKYFIINYWAHNMYQVPYDWHTGFVVYFE